MNTTTAVLHSNKAGSFIKACVIICLLVAYAYESFFLVLSILLVANISIGLAVSSTAKSSPAPPQRKPAFTPHPLPFWDKRRIRAERRAERRAELRKKRHEKQRPPILTPNLVSHENHLGDGGVGWGGTMDRIVRPHIYNDGI